MDAKFHYADRALSHWAHGDVASRRAIGTGLGLTGHDGRRVDGIVRGAMRVLLLGPIQVCTPGRATPVTGPHRRAVLAQLALHHREIVSTSRLVEAAWAGDIAVAPNSIQSHIARLRRLLEDPTAIRACTPGYVLDLGVDGVDIEMAERLIGLGLRSVEPVQRARLLQSALSLWRGQPLAELADLDWTVDHLARFAQLRLTARRALALTRLDLGECELAVSELQGLCQELPYDELVRRHLMLALWQTGRPADALATFRDLRRILHDDLGIDPGTDLRQIESAILRNDQPPSPARPWREPPASQPSQPVTPRSAASRVSHPLGRTTECAQLAERLDRARSGFGGAVVLRGEAGIGKTTLLDHLAVSATDFLVVRALGVQFESELALSGLTELLRPLAGHLVALPETYTRALSILGLSAGVLPNPATPVDRHAVYSATLALVTAAATEQPVLCLIDDAQWLDRASAEVLLFTARRLPADAVLIVFAARSPTGRSGVPAFAAPGLDELEVPGLDELASATLLSRYDLTIPVLKARLAEVTGGNPLALIELAQAMSAGNGDAALAAMTGSVPTTERLESVFAAEVRTLPPSQRLALLICAAAGSGDLSNLARALALAELDLACLDPAVTAGLIRTTGGTVTFRHPLTRSAVHSQAGPGELRRAHLALSLIHI